MTIIGTRPVVPCEVSFDGRPWSMQSSPYVCQFGFWLWDEVLISRAHFNIALKPSTLSELLADSNGRAITKSLSLSDYGSIDENRGYAAQDGGPITRPIVSLTVNVQCNTSSIRFAFDGKTGQVDPQSVFGAVGKIQCTGFDFHIAFELGEEDLQLHVADSAALNAMHEYMRAARASNDA